MKVKPFESQPDSSFKSPKCFEAILEHWARARIDTPLLVVARFDDAAKQLITIGGTLQALFIAVFALSNAAPRIPPWGILIIVPLLLTFIFCAARVICTLPPEMEAMGAYALFKKIGDSGVSEVELKAAVDKWCIGIENLARTKHKWLFAANVLFILSSAVTVSLVFCNMLPGKQP
jgi:hypothetical protein